MDAPSKDGFTYTSVIAEQERAHVGDGREQVDPAVLEESADHICGSEFRLICYSYLCGPAGS